MSKHTPGPWRHLDDRERSGRHEILATDRTVATIKWYDARSVADARLIAAAPEMYEALKAVMADYNATKSDFWGKPTQIRNSTIEAIAALFAKAEGRT